MKTWFRKGYAKLFYGAILAITIFAIVRAVVLRPTQIQHLTQLRTQRSLSAIIWDSTGTFIAAVDAEGKLYVWEASRWKIVYEWKPDLPSLPLSISWTAIGNEVVVIYLDGSVRIWNTTTWNLTHESISTSLGDRLVLGSVSVCDCILFQAGYNLQIWNLSSNSIKRIGAIGDGYPYQYSLNGRDKLAYITHGQENLQILGISEWGTEVKLDIQSSKFTALSWSSDGELLAIASKNMEILVWSQDSQVQIPLSDPSQEITGIEWSSDGKYLATIERKLRSIYDEYYLRIWQISDMKQVAVYPFEVNSRIDSESLRWSNNNEQIAVVGVPTSGPFQTEWGGIVWVYNVVQNRIVARIDAHNPFSGGAEWDPQKNRLASGTSNLLEVWDFSSPVD